MYQMYAYSKEYQTPYVCLVYPMTAEFKDKDNPHNTIIAKYKNILVSNKFNDYPNVHVYVLMVDLSTDDGVIDLFNDISQNIKKIEIDNNSFVLFYERSYCYLDYQRIQ
jgi:hypothetical protein